MRNRLVMAGLVLGMVISAGISTQAEAYSPMYGVAPLELNNQILDTTNSMHNNMMPTTSKQLAPIPSSQKNAVSKTQSTTTATSSSDTKTNNEHIYEKAQAEENQNTSLYKNQSDAEMQDMIYKIGNKIVKSNGIKTAVKFRYTNQEIANANTNGNNTITVYKGLIKYCDSEDELAYVIGHEIGHAKRSHVFKSSMTKQASSIANSAALKGIGMATNNSWAVTGVELATKTATNLGEKKISRNFEDDADLLSIDYIVNAGYNPLAAISIINKIGENYADLWSDHPSTDKRIIKMYNYIEQNYPKYISKGYNSTAYEQAINDYIHVSKKY